VTGEFTIEPLGAGAGRNEFSSGVAALDRYLYEFVTQDIRRRVSNCFVARDGGGNIAAYYTLAAGSVPLLDIPEEERKKLPRYGVLPASLIGRLAVDQRFQGRGLGGALVIDAARKSASSAQAVFALIVDAKDEQAASFYKHLGFRAYNSRPLSLYVPVSTILASLS
jgi:ribosomal protein S18 acetylase RimI-like enzyme